ncbi:MAG: TIGR04282 family arsenosugar biosynthesis glycosyltransferase [Verrucomicrobiales bacterium]|nr:TIGR04282 family arsenosugar biosynthesis glycosyltransferase [Verrucomicrobiales bacterium]
MRRAIQVFLKYPEAGRVKTRLAAKIGREEAAAAYDKMVCRVFEQCRLAGPDILSIAFDPADREEDLRAWLKPWLETFPGTLHWIAQEGADLGERLAHASDAFFEEHREAAVAIIGTDCVDLDQALFEEAWKALERKTDAVFGPTEDGGYYLLGIRKSQPGLFRGIPWSSADTLSSSLTAASEAGLQVFQLPTRADIDEVENWEKARGRLEGRTCVFFDRDGVVNRSPGPGYVLHEDAFHLQSGIAEALRYLKQRDVLAILVTSQKGVGKGLMSEGDLQRIHDKMQRQLREEGGVAFDGILAYTGAPDCLHQPKPDPEMILTASERFFVDPRRSWMIGDADRDIEMGKAAGVQGTIRIETDKPVGIAADFTLSSASEITELIRKLL